MKLSIFKYMFKIPDLRKRILFTLAMFGVYRLGASVPVPGVDLEAVQRLTDSGSQAGIYGLLNLFSGGALKLFLYLLWELCLTLLLVSFYNSSQ